MSIAILVECTDLVSSIKVAVVGKDSGGLISVTLVKADTTGLLHTLARAAFTLW